MNSHPKPPRIPLPEPDEMDAAQKAVFEKIVTGPRGRLVGPLRAALHNPSLADRWQALGQVLRYETRIPQSLSELAILVVARHWNSELEWTIHANEARKAGLAAELIDALHASAVLTMATEDELVVYEFSRQLLETGQLDDKTYDAVLTRWQAAGVVELTALIGYYSMVAMTLNAHRIPLPNDIPAELKPTAQSRTAIPPAPLRASAQ